MAMLIFHLPNSFRFYNIPFSDKCNEKMIFRRSIKGQIKKTFPSKMHSLQICATCFETLINRKMFFSNSRQDSHASFCDRLGIT